MKKLVKVLAIILVVGLIGVLSVSMMACKKDPNKEFVVATNSGFPPFESMDGDKMVGIDIDIANIFAEKLGQKLVIKDMEFDSVVTSVGTNGVDVAMAGLTVSEDRKKMVDFTDTYINASQKLIVLKDDTTFDGLDTKEKVDAKLASLPAGTKIGVQSGTVSQFYLEGDKDWEFPGFANIKVEALGSAAICIPQLKSEVAGSMVAILVDDAPAQYLVKKNPELKLIDIALTDDQYAFAVDKKQPKLLAQLNDIIKELKTSGKLEEIIAKHFA